MRKSIVEVNRKDVRYKKERKPLGLRQSKLFEFDIPRTSNPLDRSSRSCTVLGGAPGAVLQGSKEPEVITVLEDDVEYVSSDDCEGNLGASQRKTLFVQSSEDMEEDVAETGDICEILDDPEPYEVNSEVICPLCLTDLSFLYLHEREAHCDQCLLARSSVRRKRSIPLPDVKKLKFSEVTIVVDGFNFMDNSEVKYYFLSHFHADHYQGLCQSWKQGRLFCSQITANLVISKFKIDVDQITILKLNEPLYITPRLRCFPLDANHCPGALILLFEELDFNGSVLHSVLHTGDFRATNGMIRSLDQLTCGRELDSVYLDTTYLNPNYHFPLQRSVLKLTASFAAQISQTGIRTYFGDTQKSILTFMKSTRDKIISQKRFRYIYLIATYSIGKEKLAISIAEELQTKIYIPLNSPKHDLIKQYMDWIPSNIITHNIQESCVHLVSFDVLSSKESIDKYLLTVPPIYEDIVGFNPTGWSYDNGRKYMSSEATIKRFQSAESRYKYVIDLIRDCSVDELKIETFRSQYKPHKKYQVFKVPYSEHSSFKDLCVFLTKVPVSRVYSTVNLHDSEMHSMWFDTWRRIRNEMLH
ncbi:DNA cross-link repair protein PSO2 Ecym_6059 [Eremothecium cymbalariae DBVPG|uniref:DNA repair metallo-beta-lactamase domain-containing protein n=1 Tax=Eremothecium cymbalariae (strain CBS 270.75 / DBVPG 7215 / KCTC 17166 / NRRL Y-17582) TaxID=931890 RepID=G8JUY1_ERECY|nr:hypothetical protein Ecym_6059 [Eremothecium cymbalariae DBVPG\